MSCLCFSRRLARGTAAMTLSRRTAIAAYRQVSFILDPTMRTKAKAIGSLGCALLLPVGETAGFGCARRPMMRFIVPQDFHGAVFLSCSLFGENDRANSVGMDGHLDHVTCPNSTSHVEILRNGKLVASEVVNTKAFMGTNHLRSLG